MSPRSSILLLLAMALIGVSGGSLAFAQEPEDAPAKDKALPALDAAALEERLGEIENDGNLDDATRKILGDRYRDALDSLSKAKEFRAREAEFHRALKDGPGETKQLRSELENLKSAADKPPKLPALSSSDESREELESIIAEAEVVLAKLKSERQSLESERTDLRLRPDQIRERLVTAAEQLAEAGKKVEANVTDGATTTPSAGDSATAAQREARREALEAEIAMLKQEDLSQQIRDSLISAKLEVAALKLAAAEKRREALQALAASQSSDEVDRAEALVKQLTDSIPEPSPELKALLADVKKLIDESREVSDSIETAQEEAKREEKELERVEAATERIREQLELGGMEGALAPVLLEELRRLPAKPEAKRYHATIRDRLTSARGALFQLEHRVRIKDGKTEDEVEVAPISAPAELRAEVAMLQGTHDSLTGNLARSYERWLKALSDLDAASREMIVKSGAFRDLAVEKLFWIRSSPVVEGGNFRSLPEALRYCYGPERWRELRDRLAKLPVAYVIFCGSVLALLLILRRRLRRWLVESGKKTRRISADRYAHTISALVATLLLAAPLPLATLFLAVALLHLGAGQASDWIYGLGTALFGGTAFLAQACFLIVLCRREGLGEAHFQWNREILSRLRRLTAWSIPVWLLSSATILLVLTEGSGTFLDGLGRMAGLFNAFGMGFVLALLLHPEKGIAAVIHRDHPKAVFGRLRRVWFFLIVALTVFLAGLLLAGFVFTSLLLVEQIEVSLGAALGAYVIYGLAIRWFMIRERKLALEELREKRRARLEALRQEAKAVDESSESSGDEGRIPEVKEEEALELSEVSGQTRRLIAFLVAAALIGKLLLYWTQFGPVLEVLDRHDIIGDLSFADLAMIVLVGAVTLATTRNLPGLLEVVVLRRLELDSGTRNAITTLAKYVVVSIGAVVLFHRVGIDWSQFGWIAAALSVGLGFGLQEVVANFISGIILLFERPIRVGDIVTIDGIDGVVSRIQIRATTITNWDRKEFIVPNKQFVTGTLLNWTLSSSVNRIVIVVGVAYGSDTDRAQKLLAEAAEEHPLIMDDPAPLISFEEFGDSALKLVLRCYLPDMDNRLKTISELHTSIDKRFREAGIEIAFPQLDVHLRREV